MATSMTDYLNSTISQVVINDITYDIVDATTRSSVSNLDSRVTALESNKVSKSGDTMTSTLTVKRSAIDRDGTNPSADQWVSAIRMTDKDDEELTALELRRAPDGSISTFLWSDNEDSNNSLVRNYLKLGANKDGSLNYSVADPAKFRTAIGAGIGNVTGVKGNSESTYRTGNVNLTPGNIGALSLSGGTITNGEIHLRTTAVDNTKLPETNPQYFNGFTCVDINNQTTGGIGGSRSKASANDNTVKNCINTITLSANNNTSTGGTKYNSLSVKVNGNGVCTYGVTDPTAFRSAIGAAASSDRRLKHDIKPLEQDAVDFVSKLQPCVYTINNEKQVGLIAQDVHAADTWGTKMAFETVEGLDGLNDWEIMPDGSPTWKLDYIRIIPPLVATVQQQSKKIEELESKIKLLEKNN